MYECVICLSINHNSRLHCQHCGTIPAMYSATGKASNDSNRNVTAAIGCYRTGQHKAQRIILKTVGLDYYAT